MTTPPKIPLNFFGIPFGLLGLADCWLVAANFGLVTVTVGRVLVAIAVAVWLVVLSAYVRGALARGTVPGADLTDPIAGPFGALIVIMPTLAAADGLYPLSHAVGAVVVDVGSVLILLCAGWFTGQWIYRDHDIAKVHPGYFLPNIAGPFVAAASTALVGQTHLAQMLFGLGVISWIMIGSIVLGRMLAGPQLPGPLLPTIAIEVAPAGVASFAWFVIDGQQVDLVLRLLAGYGLMMVVAQLRLLPAYLRLRFMPSFWAFTFSWAAVSFAGLFWLGVCHPTGWRAESWAALVLITLFIGAIAVRTAVALSRGDLIPAPVPAPAAAPVLAPPTAVVA